MKQVELPANGETPYRNQRRGRGSKESRSNTPETLINNHSLQQHKQHNPKPLVNSKHGKAFKKITLQHINSKLVKNTASQPLSSQHSTMVKRPITTDRTTIEDDIGRAGHGGNSGQVNTLSRMDAEEQIKFGSNG